MLNAAGGKPRSRYRSGRDLLHRAASLSRSSPRASRARASTASIIASVSLPVNVFCWLGWKQPSSVYGPTCASAPWPNRGFGRGTCDAELRAARAAPRPRRSCPSATQHARVASSSAQLAHQIGQAVVALGRRRACSPAARSARPPSMYASRQPQAVAAALRLGLVREAGAVKRREQPVARAVAREDPARCGCRRGRPAPGRRSPAAPRGSPKPGSGRAQ